MWEEAKECPECAGQMTQELDGYISRGSFVECWVWLCWECGHTEEMEDQ